MKLLILVGSGAVGKMTVGQSIMRKTALRLFHNHMMIEPVIEIFGEYNHSVVAKLRRTIFEEFLKTEREGLIFTYMWAFDCPEDGDYIRSVAELFRSQGAEIYCAELVAPQSVRLERNRTENRLRHKASKRDLNFSIFKTAFCASPSTAERMIVFLKYIFFSLKKPCKLQYM